MKYFAEGYTADEVLREITLEALRTIEYYCKHWVMFDESQYINGEYNGRIDQAVRLLCILHDGYLPMLRTIRFYDDGKKPVIQICLKDGWHDIDLKDLSAMFGIDYDSFVKLDE